MLTLSEVRARAARGPSTVFVPVEFRSDGQDGVFTVRGHAAVFDRWSQDLGGFVERLARGAFRKALTADTDVSLLREHNPLEVLASRKMGNLSVREDARGLAFDSSFMPSHVADYTEALLRSGYYDSMSFSFTVAPGGDKWEETPSGFKRTIYEIGELREISIVKNPAYPQTDVSPVRDDGAVSEVSVLGGVDVEALARAISKSFVDVGVTVSEITPVVSSSSVALASEPDGESTGDVADPVAVVPDVDSTLDAVGGQDVRHLSAAWRRDQLRKRIVDAKAS